MTANQRDMHFQKKPWITRDFLGLVITNTFQDPLMAYFIFSEKGNLEMQIPIDESSLSVLRYSVNILHTQ